MEIGNKINEIREIVATYDLTLEDCQQMSLYVETLIWLDKRDMWGRIEKEMGYLESYVRNCLTSS